MFDDFSFESEEDDNIMNDDVLVNDETAVDESGDDSETVNVTPDTKETAHNEEASAGGVSTGNNQEQLEMDPVAATESYILRQFGLSREDMEEGTVETIDEAETIPNADVVEDDADPDLEATAVPPTTSVNITSPTNTHIDVNAAADEVEVGTDTELNSDDGAVVDEVPENPVVSDAEIAATEGLRRLWSREDDGADDAASSDVELDVKTSEQDMNIALSGKAVTLEPNEDGDDMGGDDSGSDDFGGSDDEGSGDDSGSDEGEGEGGSDDFGGSDEGNSEDEGEEGNEGLDEDQQDEGASGESFYWF